MNLNSLCVAIVYDKATTFGGAERVLLALNQLFPQAPLYTSVHNPLTAPWTRVFPKVHTSFIQHLPLATTKPQLYAPLMPLAFESFDFTPYQLVISVTSYEAKGIITSPQTLHLCYLLTPNRFLWVDPGYTGYRAFGPLDNFVHVFKAPILSQLRLWDQQAATRPDAYLTISRQVQSRITKYYRRPSQVIYPPVDSDYFTPSSAPSSNYFLVVSRLTAYKKIDLVIDTFNTRPDSLKIVGTGPEMLRLARRITNPRIQLLGFQTNAQLRTLYRNCQALIMPQQEDFGIVGLEALASGKPVITYAHSGIAELLTPNTGLTFDQQTPQSLDQALDQYAHTQFSATTCRHLALKHSISQFTTQFSRQIISSLQRYDKFI